MNQRLEVSPSPFLAIVSQAMLSTFSRNKSFISWQKPDFEDEFLFVAGFSVHYHKERAPHSLASLVFQRLDLRNS